MIPFHHTRALAVWIRLGVWGVKRSCGGRVRSCTQLLRRVVRDITHPTMCHHIRSQSQRPTGGARNATRPLCWRSRWTTRNGAARRRRWRRLKPSRRVRARHAPFSLGRCVTSRTLRHVTTSDHRASVRPGGRGTRPPWGGRTRRRRCATAGWDPEWRDCASGCSFLSR